MKTTTTVRNATDELGRKLDGIFLVTVRTDSFRKGVGSKLKSQMLVWAKWFRSQGATSVKLTSRRALYSYAHNSSMILGTHWTMRVEAQA